MTPRLLRPSLVLAGAPRCGTSTLYRWLADHPEVCGSTPKETFFLMDPDHPLCPPHNVHTAGWQGYARHFPDPACGDAPVVFEATTHYLYQATTPVLLAGLDPPPTVLFLLRRPSERCRSSFLYTKHNLASVDPALGFAEYVRLVRENPDEIGRRVRTRSSAYVLARDVQYGVYADYVSAWLRHLPPERVHVLVLEHMQRDPRRFMGALAARLGINPGFYDDYRFARSNASIRLRSAPLHRFARRLGALAPRTRLRTLVREAYMSLATRQGTPPDAADAEALAWLDEYYAPSQAALGRLTGLDLDPWPA